MEILIVEDESLAQERLQYIINQYDPSIKIVGCVESVEETIKWFATKPHPDLLLMDIHLSDGLSFDVFKKINITKPIIFTTAYDNYAIDAFQLFSIDYILKPITVEALATAINKYKAIASTFIPKDYSLLSEQINDNISTNYKTRFLAKVGQRLFFISVGDVACFSADNKIVYLLDKEGNRFVINTTIEKLETQLNPQHFFRINRKIIVNVDAIEQLKPYTNNRLKLQVKGVGQNEELIISRERVSDFKMWADN
jgi:DNA-binding LytR/AlgR family response regulator